MCGIAGFTNRSNSPLKCRSAILRQVLKHRGPDDFGSVILEGTHTSATENLPDSIQGEAALLHWRLSILDLTKAGWQPMSSGDKRHHLVFNGEIYNYLELRRELEAAGIQ